MAYTIPINIKFHSTSGTITTANHNVQAFLELNPGKQDIDVDTPGRLPVPLGNFEYLSTLKTFIVTVIVTEKNYGKRVSNIEQVEISVRDYRNRVKDTININVDLAKPPASGLVIIAGAPQPEEDKIASETERTLKKIKKIEDN